MKYEKENQKLVALIWLELLGESNFHFWEKFMTEVLEAKQLLRESESSMAVGVHTYPPTQSFSVQYVLVLHLEKWLL